MGSTGLDGFGSIYLVGVLFGGSTGSGLPGGFIDSSRETHLFAEGHLCCGIVPKGEVEIAPVGMKPYT